MSRPGKTCVVHGKFRVFVLIYGNNSFVLALKSIAVNARMSGFNLHINRKWCISVVVLRARLLTVLLNEMGLGLLCSHTAYSRNIV